MHTAFDLKEKMFAVTVDGAPASRDALLDWEPRDRLGVVIDRQVGALGAGLMTLLAITAFYDVAGQKRRTRPLYPDIFLFHVGGPWGCFINFDYWPDHKEVMVAPDPTEVLRAINNRGITHLIVPDRPRQGVEHRFKEPEAAIDRIKQCFVYGPDGATADADVRIRCTDMSILGNYEGVLELDNFIKNFSDMPDPIPLRLRSTSPRENQLSFEHVARRASELRKDHPDFQSARRRVNAVRAAGVIEETYRRSNVAEILEMLG